MPNHVTTKIHASEEVLNYLMVDGKVDFNTVIPMPERLKSTLREGVNCSAETAAARDSGVPLPDNPLMRRLEESARARENVDDFDDEAKQAYLTMMDNHRETGYLNSLEFAKEEWGTKWNASKSYIEDNMLSFDSAWDHPDPVIHALSKQFPDEIILVAYADEDIGSNCGRYAIQNGVILKSDIAPSYSSMSEEEEKRWTIFACQVTGRDIEEYCEETERSLIETDPLSVDSPKSLMQGLQ